MKKTFLLLPLLAIILNSCHKAEDKGRLVSSIDFVGSDYTARHEYDTRNRLIKIGDAYANYTYPSAKTIVMTNSEGYVVTFTLNKDGNVVSWVDNEDRTTTYTYSNNYLTKIETIGRTYKRTQTLTWDNGNITTIQLTDGDRPVTYTYEYGSTLNKYTSIDLSILCLDIRGYLDFLSLGLFGKSCQYMPSKVAVLDETHRQMIAIASFRYETDSDGYVTNIYGKNEAISDAEEHLRYVIQYK